MKTERRHELQKNELADALGHELDYLRPYYKTIIGVLIAVAAVGVTIAILSANRQAKNAAAWGSFYDVVADGGGDKMPRKLEGIASAYPGTDAALWAELAAGDVELRSGSAKMFTDRSEADEALDRAKKHFEAVIEAGKSKVMLRRRAQLGLAETFDAMNEPEKAQPLYEELIKDNPEDAFGKAATERLAQLKRLEESGFYTWFAQHKPTPPAENPLHGRGSLGDLPSRNNLNSDLQAPGIIRSELMDIEDEGTDEPGIEFDAPRTKAPRDKKDDAFRIDPANIDPAPNDPAPSDPDSSDPPADDKKADAPPADEKTDDNTPADPAPSDPPPADEKKTEAEPADESNPE